MSKSKNKTTAIRSFLFLGTGFLASSGLNYLFQIGAGRYLGPEKYGVLSVLLSLMAIVAISGQILQLIVIEEMLSDELPKMSSYPLDPFTLDVLSKTTFLAVSIILLSPLGSYLLGIDTFKFWSVAFFCYPAALEWIARGRLIGLGLFKTLSIFTTLQSLAKICILVLAVFTQYELTFILFSLSISSLLVTSLSLWKTRHGRMNSHRFHLSKAFMPMMSLTLFWVMISTNVIYARFSLTTTIAGQYAASSLLGTASLWVPIMIIQLKYPDIVTDGKNLSRRDNRPLIWILCSGILTSLFLWLVGNQILLLLYGSNFDSVQNLAWKISVACIPFSIVNYLQHELIASKSFLHVKWLIVCAVAEAGLMYFLPQTPNFIAFALFLSGCMSVYVTSQDRMLSSKT